jgi:hypothetical protein
MATRADFRAFKFAVSLTGYMKRDEKRYTSWGGELGPAVSYESNSRLVHFTGARDRGIWIWICNSSNESFMIFCYRLSVIVIFLRAGSAWDHVSVGIVLRRENSLQPCLYGGGFRTPPSFP